MSGIKAGLFAPPAQLPPLDYAGLQKAVTEAREALQKLIPTTAYDIPRSKGVPLGKRHFLGRMRLET